MMEVLEQMRRDAKADIEIAQARLQACEIVQATFEQLKGMGFMPVISDTDGLISLRFDPCWIETVEVAEVAEPVAAPAAKPAPAAAKPEAAASDLIPAPAPAKKSPSFVVGPFTSSERDEIIRRSAEGEGIEDIAVALNRNPKNVGAQVKHYLATEIFAARKAAQPQPKSSAMTMPARQPAPEARPATASAPEATLAKDFWTASRDHALATSLARGDGAGSAAQHLGIDKQSALARWRELNPHPGDLDYQTKLLQRLTTRAAEG